MHVQTHLVQNHYWFRVCSRRLHFQEFLLSLTPWPPSFSPSAVTLTCTRLRTISPAQLLPGCPAEGCQGTPVDLPWYCRSVGGTREGPKEVSTAITRRRRPEVVDDSSYCRARRCLAASSASSANGKSSLAPAHMWRFQRYKARILSS